MSVPPMPGLWNWPNPLPGLGVRRRSDGLEAQDYAGYKVVANDGEIGHIDSFAIAPDEAHLVVDTGGWLFGRMSVIPAAAVRVVNHDSQTVQIDLTKQQIKDAPGVRPLGRLRPLPRRRDGVLRPDDVTSARRRAGAGPRRPPAQTALARLRLRAPGSSIIGSVRLRSAPGPARARPPARRSSRSRRAGSRPRANAASQCGSTRPSCRATRAPPASPSRSRRDEGVPALVLDAVDEVPVVEPGAAARRLPHVEADRVDDVQPASGRGGRAADRRPCCPGSPG